MCQRVTCRQCSKPTYAGCGAHIEQVLSDVPRDQRCRCREAKSKSAGKNTGSAGPAESGTQRSWFQQLFGR